MGNINDKRPNILFIMTDQMRGDCLGLDGHQSLLTPNMDELGAKGAYFSKAYTTSASCIPARRSLLTGQYPVNNGLVGYRDGVPITGSTFPEIMKDSGYFTALAGRYMHQYPPDKDYGFEKRILGSTYKDDDEYALMLQEKAPETAGIKGHGISYNGWTAKPWHLSEHLHPTNWTVRQARNMLKESQTQKPLLLTTSFYAPHPPFIPPRFYMNRYIRLNTPEPAIGEWANPPKNKGLGAGIDAHRTCLEGEALKSAQAGYYGMINHLDDQLYFLISDFKQKSQKQNRPWVIILSSDHGEMLGDHYYFRKCEPYEGSSRIPFLIQGSSELGFTKGIECDSPVCLEDIMPTLLDIAGISIPENIDGKSLLPVLRGNSKKVRSYLHAEHSPCYSQEQAYQMLIDGKYKYIWRPADNSEQLFNLKDDPQELKDLSLSNKNESKLNFWRNKLIDKLKDRPGGFVENNSLSSVKTYEDVIT